MKYRYLSIFLLVLILSVGAVCAQDNATDDSNVIAASSDDVISVDSNVDALQVNESDELKSFSIDDSNFNNYFDENGTILESANISDNSRILLGNISNRVMVFDKILTIIPNDDSVLTNVGITFNAGSDNSTIRGLTFQNTDGITAITVFNASDLAISDNTISVSGGTDGLIAVSANYAKNLLFSSNNVTYSGKSNGTVGKYANAIRVSNSDNALIGENNFRINVTSVDVPWNEVPAASGNWVSDPVSEGIVVKDSNNVTLSTNTIILNATDFVTDSGYDTVYVVDINNCTDAYFGSNYVAAQGQDYIYGLIASGDNLNITTNSILVQSPLNYACGIDIEGPAIATVENNVIGAISPMSAYAVYAAMSNGNVSVDYINNTIGARAYAAFGMELSGIVSNVFDNTIRSIGNYTTGIASRVDALAVAGNNITATGSGEGNESIWDGFGVDNVGIKVIKGLVIIENNNITANGKGIVASGVNLTAEGNSITVTDTGLADSYAISVSDSTGVNINDNTVNYTGKTNGTFVNNALYVADSAVESIDGNTFDIAIPSVDVAWSEIPAGSENWVSSPVSEGIVLKNDTGLVFANNIINLNATDVITAYGYDTIYAVDVDSDNAVVDNNIIAANGKDYIYGLIISGENLTVSNNTIQSESDSYYANGIDVEGPASGVFEDNVIAVSSPVVAYGIYSSMSGSDVNATYHNNIIRGEADIIYGMELAGTNETVTENTIELDGNKTMGIAGKSNTLNIKQNQIKALGKNLGNTTLWESFEPETVGVKIIGGNATVYGNNIKSNGISAVNVTTTNASVTYNYLVSNESFGDASVYFDGNATVHDNLPDYDAFLETDDVIMYYKNGTRFTANLVNFYGEPLENMTITFTINGVDYNRTTDENGTASMAINLPSGVYEVITTFDPGYNKTPTVNSNSLTVLTTVFGDDLVKVYRNESQYYATFVDGQGNPLASGTEVKFNINGVWYNRKITENGTAKLNINLPQGEYIITAVNPENGEMHTNNITVLSSITDNADLVKYYKNDSQYVVTVLGADGNPVGAGENVTFNINGVMYTRQTNASGQAKLNINLQPGNYTITAEYNGCKVSNNIEVLPVLRANDLVKKYGVSDQFIAYLVDGQGKPFEGQNVTFNINGVFYNRLTDSDGRAILNIKLGAAMDTYIITSSYNGSSISNKISVIP